jgi:hypothetical protein
MLLDRFGITFESQDAKTTFEQILLLKLFPEQKPDQIKIDDSQINFNRVNTEELLARSIKKLIFLWDNETTDSAVAWKSDGAAWFRVSNFEFNEQKILLILSKLDNWEIATFSSAHFEWGSDFDYYAPGFGSPLGVLGWGCAFKGEGHNRIVSRRFLEFNPWRVIRDEEHDITLIQFHDLEADAKTALEQARVGHDIMGDPYMGGFIQKNYSVNNPDFSGLYSSDEKMLRFIIADREITKAEMLDACAIRLYQLLGKDQPVERLAFVFAYSSEFAKPYLHDLWLREIEVWAIDKGVESRLDLDYKPTLEKPDWVVALEKA